MNKKKKKKDIHDEIKGFEQNIAFSKAVMFLPKEKALIMKMLDVTIDDYILKAKKSHRIILKCFWKNVGCYKKGENTGEWIGLVKDRVPKDKR